MGEAINQIDHPGWFMMQRLSSKLTPKTWIKFNRLLHFHATNPLTKLFNYAKPLFAIKKQINIKSKSIKSTNYLNQQFSMAKHKVLLSDSFRDFHKHLSSVKSP